MHIIVTIKYNWEKNIRVTKCQGCPGTENFGPGSAPGPYFVLGPVPLRDF